MAEAGGFDHNGHTLRLLTRLESPIRAFPGSTSAGRRSRGSPSITGRSRRPAGRWPRRMPNSRSSSAAGRASRRRSRRSPTTSPMTITTSTMACAPGCSRSTNCSSCRFVARLWDDGARRAIPASTSARLVPELVRDQIGRMVNDVLDETRRRIAEAGVDSVDEVRAAGRPLAGFSPAMAAEERALKTFLYARMYRSPPSPRGPGRGAADRRRPLRRLSRRSAAAARRAWRGGGRGRSRAARDRRLHRRHDRPLRHRPLSRAGRADDLPEGF